MLYNIGIDNVQVYGLDKSIIASGNPMRTELDDNSKKATDKDIKRAEILGNTKAGEGHDQFLTGIIVQFNLCAPLYMWKQLQRYHFLDFVSSQSTMHCLTKFGNIQDCCVRDTDEIILKRYQELLNEYNNSEVKDKQKWRTLVASLPSGFLLEASLSTNFRQLKTIYNQRKNHKLEEWHEFCEWCETLPMFKELCLGGK